MDGSEERLAAKKVGWRPGKEMGSQDREKVRLMDIQRSLCLRKHNWLKKGTRVANSGRRSFKLEI